MSKKITIAIPDEMYHRVERIARLREQEIAEVLLESIVLTEAEQVIEDEDSIVAREEAAFKRLHPMLREKYLGQYVAIYQGKMIDHDPDQVALFLRTKERYPDEFIWIAPVGEKPEETYVLRSPRFVENGS
jgi:uncharacterized protein (DUF1778 family)